MRVLDSDKTIALLEKVKKLLPGKDGSLPGKCLSKDGMDAIIQGLRANTVNLDILVNMIGLAQKKKDSDNLLVGFDHSHGNIAVLIVGRRTPVIRLSRLSTSSRARKPRSCMGNWWGKE